MNYLGGLDEIEEKNEDMEEVTKESPKRKPFHYWNVGGRDYRLKLNTSMIEKLENKYRANILNVVSVDGIPPLSVMLTIIQAAMTPWEHGISYADVKNLYEKWCNDGGNQMSLYTEILMPTMAVSGFFTEKQAMSILESMKNTDDLL